MCVETLTGVLFWSSDLLGKPFRASCFPFETLSGSLLLLLLQIPQVRSGRNFTLAMARGLAELQIHFETTFRLSLRRQGRNVGFNQGQVARDDDHEHRPEKE